MALDIELYRRTIYAPVGGRPRTEQPLRRISVIDIHPDGATRTLVFVHGYGGSVEQWQYQLRFFGQTMRVIAPDIRGHGSSDDPEGLAYSMDGLVNDLEYVLDCLDIQRPFYLIAHSFGGAIATEYAVRHAENMSGLVLIGVPTRFIIRPILRRLMAIPDPIFSWVAKKIRVALFAPQRTLVRMHDRIMSSWRGDERLRQIKVPTLVILGQRDTVFLRQHYEDVPRSILGAQKVIIPVSAHLVQLERPDAVNRTIHRFMEARRQDGKGDTRRPTSAPLSMNVHAARHAEMPWLQYYDDGVPEELPRPKQPLHDLLSNAAFAFPNRPALIFFRQKIGYRELDRLSNRFAHALQELLTEPADPQGSRASGRRRLGDGVAGSHFKAMDVKKGALVAIVLPNIPQFVIAFYGTLKAGGTVVLGTPLSNEAEITYQLQHSGAQVLVTLTSYRAKVGRLCANTNVRHVIYTDVREYLPLRERVLIASLIDETTTPDLVGTRFIAHHGEGDTPATPSHIMLEVPPQLKEKFFQPLLRKQPTTPIDSGVTSDDLALLQYTSGTTDIPKGVMLSHSNLVVNVAQVRHWMTDARRGREVILDVLPLSHIYGLTACMNLSIALAGSIILMPTTRIAEILRAIKQAPSLYRPTLFPAVPGLYLAMANYPRVRSYGIASIRICISGSASLPVEVQEAFEKLTRGRLVEGYGLTEASPVTHSNPLKGERRIGSIGIPLPGTHARIVDVRTGEPLPPDEVGELLIRGPQVMQGYWNMPEETRETLKDGWLHTGDLARMDEEGFFTIVDRKKDLILAGSYNVYPRDVEEVLYEHPKVFEAAVVSIPAQREIHGTHEASTPVITGTTSNASPFIKAVVVLKRGEKATADELLALCQERLDAYKVPRQIEFRNELPKNSVGKVLRRLLIEA